MTDQIKLPLTDQQLQSAFDGAKAQCGMEGPILLLYGREVARLAVEQNTKALRARVAELEKDAARYRHIRSRSNSLEGRPSCYHMVGGVRELKWEDDLDAAIDAALSKEKP